MICFRFAEAVPLRRRYAAMEHAADEWRRDTHRTRSITVISLTQAEDLT